MSEIVRQNGEFCWEEMMSSDLKASREFYAKVFGWEVENSGMPDFEYYLPKANGHSFCGMMALPAEMAQYGVPSHWNSYVKVANVDASGAKASALGAKVMGPMDIPNVGRFSVVTSPTGETICLFEYRAEIDGQPEPDSSSVVGCVHWRELYTRDLETSKKFYNGLFGWTTQEMEVDGGHKYTFFVLGDKYVAGAMKMDDSAGWEGVPPHWDRYIKVENADETLGKALECGGEKCHDNFDIPQWGRVGFIKDPSGAVLSFVQNFDQPAA